MTEGNGTPITIIVVMGVSGSGKTTVGQRLAERLGYPFYDGDDFHPPANVEKMSRGVALTDDDRWPWLDAIRDHIAALAARRQPAVIACSALKAAYRERLLEGADSVRFVYLRGSLELIDERLRVRSGHFFDPELLASQFAALEEPADGIAVDIAHEPEEIVSRVVRRLGLADEAGGPGSSPRETS